MAVRGPTMGSRLSAPVSSASGPALRVPRRQCRVLVPVRGHVRRRTSCGVEWDLTKEIARIDGPFALGASGWAKQRGTLGGTFTITAIEPGRSWISECPVPLGKIVFEHLIESAEPGRVRVTKSVVVLGGFGPLFRLTFGTKMRRDITESLEALGRHIRD